MGGCPMESLFNLGVYLDHAAAARDWLAHNALAISVATMGQILVVGGTFVAARYIAPHLRGRLASVAKGRFEMRVIRIARALEPLLLPTIWLTLLWLSVLIATGADLPLRLINIVVSLLTAWAVIRLTASLVQDPAWSRFVAVTVWAIAALNILNLLAPAMDLLDSAAINLGTLRVSALT